MASPTRKNSKRPKIVVQEEVVLEKNVVCDETSCRIEDGTEENNPEFAILPSSPRPTRPNNKAVYELVISQSIESKLGDFGYTPTGKLVIKDETINDWTARFIKAYDKNCNQIYIYNNTGGYAGFSEQDMVEVDTSTSNLPSSIRIGLAQTATKDMYGIAVESKDTITILRMEGNRLDEQRYRLNSNSNDPYGDYTAYPIYRFSDISTNPRDVLNSSRMAVAALDTERARGLFMELEVLCEQNDQLAILAHQGKSLLRDYYGQVEDSLALLHNLNKYYSENDLDEEEKNKYLDVRHNIMIRRDYLQTIFRLLEQMRKMSNDIQHKVEILRAVKQEALDKIVDIDSVISR